MSLYGNGLVFIRKKGEVMSYYDLPSRSRSFCETFKLGSNQLPVFLCGF